MSATDDQKRAAGEAAAELIEAGMTIGLGTGSTADWFVRALAERRLDVLCVATSEATATLAATLGLHLATLDEVEAIDLTVDGADEIAPDLALIKGAGAALLREKLVWMASKRCVVIADARKPVAQLGAFSLPIEVVRFGHRHTAARITAALAAHGVTAPPKLRLNPKGDGPAITDSGNVLYDAACGVIADPPALAAALKDLVGVVEHGLFLGLAERALIADASGVTTLWPWGA
jgi:ribose 5-phosphate isomerase A